MFYGLFSPIMSASGGVVVNVYHAVCLVDDWAAIEAAAAIGGSFWRDRMSDVSLKET